MPANLKGYLDLPPVWLLFFMILAFVQRWFWNPFGFSSVELGRIGWFLIAMGVLLTVWSALHFRAHKTSIIPRNTPRSIITGGPYRFSRNPIYLADALMLTGVLLLLGTLIGFVTIPLFIFIINSRFIEGEEAGIRATFPDEAEDFFSNTRRWI